MRAAHVLAGTSLVLAVTLGVTAGRMPTPERYDIDPAHTYVGFVARHLLVSNVKGRFKTFSGNIMLDEQDISRSSVTVTIDAASLDTENERRDADLRSSNFFQVDSFPNITFNGKRVERNGDQNFLIGDLTIRGVTREVRVPFQLVGPFLQSGRKRIGVEASLKVNRFDYGLKWNRLQEAVQIVGDSIKIELEVEAATPRPPTQAANR